MREVFEHCVQNDDAGGKKLKVLLKVLSLYEVVSPTGLERDTSCGRIAEPSSARSNDSASATPPVAKAAARPTILILSSAQQRIILHIVSSEESRTGWYCQGLEQGRDRMVRNTRPLQVVASR